MKDLTLDNITAVAADSFAGLADARQRELVQTLVRHLHAYAREVKLTHAEWRAAIARQRARALPHRGLPVARQPRQPDR